MHWLVFNRKYVFHFSRRVQACTFLDSCHEAYQPATKWEIQYKPEPVLSQISVKLRCHCLTVFLQTLVVFGFDFEFATEKSQMSVVSQWYQTVWKCSNRENIWINNTNEKCCPFTSFWQWQWWTEALLLLGCLPIPFLWTWNLSNTFRKCLQIWLKYSHCIYFQVC